MIAGPRPVGAGCRAGRDQGLPITRIAMRSVPVRTDIVPGAVFPDYELKHHTGQSVRLSTLQGVDPMVLILTRGNF
jgi:hypothetical protein